MADPFNIWWPIGILTVDDGLNGLRSNDLVYIVDSTEQYSSSRMKSYFKTVCDSEEIQELLLCGMKACICDATSPYYVIYTKGGRVIQVAKDLIRRLDPEEFEAIILSSFDDINNDNMGIFKAIFSFFALAPHEYVDKGFGALYSRIKEIMEELRIASFLHCEQKRAIIGYIFTAFEQLMHHRSIYVIVERIPPGTSLQDIANDHSSSHKLMEPKNTFSEEAMVIMQQLMETIKQEQATNPCLYFDDEILMEYIQKLKKVEWLYPALFDVFKENCYRKSAVRKAFAAMKRYYEDRTDQITKPIFLPYGKNYPKIMVTTFVETIIHVLPNLFDSYANIFCLFVCLEPSLALALEEEQFYNRVISVLNNAITEKGSRRSATFDTLLADQSVTAAAERYYISRMEVFPNFHYKDKMFCTLSYRKFGKLWSSYQLEKTVVLAPPPKYDRNLYGMVTPDMRVTVKRILLEDFTGAESLVPFEPSLKCYHNGLEALPRSFLATWVTDDNILKQYLLALMNHEEMHLAQYVAELILDDESKAKVFYDCFLTLKTTNKKHFENIFHTGVWWHLFISCMGTCKGVRAIFPQYATDMCKKFCEATTSTMSLGTLQYYYHRLKEHFNEEDQRLMEEKLEAREAAEIYFNDYINAMTDYAVDKGFQSFASSHTYVYFICFIYRIMNQILTGADVSYVEKDLIVFRDTGFQVPHFRQSFVDMNFKKQMEILVKSTLSRQVPKEQIEHIFNYTWAQLHAKDMIGKVELDQFDKSSIETIKKLRGGAFATVHLAKVPNRPCHVVVKMPYSGGLEKFREIGVELDSLMRTLSHPHVVNIFGYVVEDGDYVGIVMEYCEGGTLQKLLRDPYEVMDQARLLHFITQAASGLLFLHQHDIVHKDVKPDNMLLDRYKNLLKLADFGISKLPKKDEPAPVFRLKSSALTKADQEKAAEMGIHTVPAYNRTGFIGTVGYSSPEANNHVYIPAVDVFSLGRSGWAMIYGRHPDDVLVALTWGAPNSFKDVVPEPNFTPSNELRSILGRMMHENLEKRLPMQQAYDELIQLKEQLLPTVVQARPSIRLRRTYSS